SWRFDDDRQWNRRSLPWLDHFRWRRRYLVFPKFFFGANFVESYFAPIDTLASVRDPATFQNFLNLAIFAKRPVDRDEGEIDIVRQLEVFVAHIDFHRF